MPLPNNPSIPLWALSSPRGSGKKASSTAELIKAALTGRCDALNILPRSHPCQRSKRRRTQQIPIHDVASACREYGGFGCLPYSPDQPLWSKLSLGLSAFAAPKFVQMVLFTLQGVTPLYLVGRSTRGPVCLPRIRDRQSDCQEK